MSAPASSDPFALRRLRMVENQLRPCGVTDLALLSAFLEAPRETFVESTYAALAYLDREAPALRGAGRMLLAPTVLARLVQAAAPQRSERALDVAGGSGFSASILGRLGVRVVALETELSGQGAHDLLAGLSDVDAVVGDLALGVVAKGPFDVILVNGAFEVPPDRLIDQMKEGGRLVGVDASYPAPKAVLIEKAGGAVTKRVLFDAAASLLDAFRRSQGFAF